MLDYGRENAINAEYREVRERKEETKTVATLDTFQLYRHDLKKGTVTPEIERIAKELELDKELGLKNQAEITADAALQHDIDELTTSNDYFQVSKDLLERLFSINKLQLNCWWHNLKSWVASFVSASTLSLCFLAIMSLTIYPLILLCIHLSHAPDTFTTFILFISAFFAWSGEVALLIATIMRWCNDFSMKYEVLKVKLDMTPLKKVDMKIPYGAKLKVQEAAKTGIFEDFVLAKPVFSVEQKEIIIDLKKPDPAILGITKDSRMFMIVYWDIQKDKEKVLKEIHRFKKYKLTA